MNLSSVCKKPLHPSSNYCNFTARSLSGLLLKSVEKHNSPPCVEDIEDAVDVAAALLSQFPQAVLNVTGQRFAGMDVAQAQLLKRPCEAGLRFGVERSDELAYRLTPTLINIEDDRPFSIVIYYTYFRIASHIRPTPSIPSACVSRSLA